MQGSIVARDLIEEGASVFLSGHNSEHLTDLLLKYPGIEGEIVDLRQSKILQNLLERVHPRIIINCAEGDWNVEVYHAALAGGSHVIDLGSTIPMTKEQLAMGNEFLRHDLCAITGCGSTPGINDIALAHALKELDTAHEIELGFAWNSNINSFVVPFSMESVIEEFTESATILQNGKWAERVPMDTVELRNFRGIGSQRCFLARHPEVYTFYHDWKNRGLQDIRFYAGFPEHSFERIKEMASTLDVNRTVVVPDTGRVPLASLSHILNEVHPKPVGYKEQENLWVLVRGMAHGIPKEIFMECFVPTLPGWEEAGCNIDTGFPASIIAQMILDGTIKARGSFAPGPVVPWAPFTQRLGLRGMIFSINGKNISLNE